jgi:hypothetical protein
LRRYHSHSNRKGEQGLIITLVAVFMTSVVVVMAALAIDVTTFYTARSEAQLAADGAALTAARVLANSGMTSSVGLSPPFPTSATETLARTAAVQVAESNEIGGKALSSAGAGAGACGAAQISVCFNDSDANFMSNPHVTVLVSTDLPTFFLRFWSKQLTVSASATAEAYNPSGLSTKAVPAAPVAPLCVKPWVLPNWDPIRSPPQVTIFDEATGAITNPALIGQGWSLSSQIPTGGTIPGQYYALAIGAALDELPAPTQALPACSSGLTTPYQVAIAGCVSTPLQCGSGQRVRIDEGPYGLYPKRDADTLVAAECLLHSTSGQPGETDQIDYSGGRSVPPFEFTAGSGNLVTSKLGQIDVLVSDSLVTIPVYRTNKKLTAPPNFVTVIGFLQLFLNPLSAPMPNPALSPPPYSIPATIINQIGCGTNATGTPVYGNGPSAVPVRLITPP